MQRRLRGAPSGGARAAAAARPAPRRPALFGLGGAKTAAAEPAAPPRKRVVRGAPPPAATKPAPAAKPSGGGGLLGGLFGGGKREGDVIAFRYDPAMQVSSAASLSCQLKQKTANQSLTNQPTNHSPTTTEIKTALRARAQGRGPGRVLHDDHAQVGLDLHRVAGHVRCAASAAAAAAEGAPAPAMARCRNSLLACRGSPLQPFLLSSNLYSFPPPQPTSCRRSCARSTRTRRSR